MLDIELIRQHPDQVANQLAKRGKDYSLSIKRIVQLDEQWRSLVHETNELNAERNTISAQVGKIDRSSSEFVTLQKKAKALKEQIAANTQRNEATVLGLEQMLLSLPNIPNEKVPTGVDEKDNLLISE